MPKLTPRNYIQKAVAAYREQHGATELGSYRDTITDVFHIAFEDDVLRKQHSFTPVPDTNINWDAFLKDQLLWPAYTIFEEERETAELSLVENIPTEDLPLHVNDEWEFIFSQQLFKERLKNAKKEI